MQAELFRLRALRPLTADGQRLVRGAVFAVDAAGAVELLRAGAAILVDDGDLQRLLQAAQHATCEQSN